MKKSVGAKTLIYPTPTWIVCAYDHAGKPNGATVAWGGICCSDPVCMTISLRKATYTYGNIKERKAFTINVPSEKFVKEADFFGIASGKREDKFAATGLTAAKSELVDAPFIVEFPVVVECTLLQMVELGLHTQFIGQVRDVKIDETVLTNKHPDIEKIKPIVYDPGAQTYRGIGAFLGEAFAAGKQIKS